MYKRQTQGFAYAPLQREAIRKAMTENCLVLTVGPGTGKTTTVNAILQLQDGVHGGGLAGAGADGEHQTVLGHGLADGFPLQRRIGKALGLSLIHISFRYRCRAERRILVSDLLPWVPLSPFIVKEQYTTI